MPLFGWNTYAKHLPGHLQEDVARLVNVTAFPYMTKEGRSSFLQGLRGTTRSMKRQLSKEEYMMRLASAGIKFVETGQQDSGS